MEESLPNWLNEDFLKLAIANGNENSNKIEIVSYKFEPAVESGNNYCSILYRVNVEYSRKEDNAITSISFIIKAPLVNDSITKHIVDEANLVKNEYNVYNKILPKMFEILNYEFSPRIFFCQHENFLVMEDLREKGYTMCDRLHQLDYAHCKQFIVSLAKYHATTVALHNTNPALVESNGNEPFYYDKVQQSTNIMLISQNMKYKVISKTIGKYKNMEALAMAIQENSDTLTDALVNIFNRRGKLNVLNHGDCWVANILYKYDKEGKVMDCKLIDFQIRRYGSPAIDLVYFMFTSPTIEVREHYMNDLFEIYRRVLNETLSKLNCKEQLSAQDLEEELRQMCPWALATAVGYLPYILKEPDNSPTLNTNYSEESFNSLDINTNPYLTPLLGKTYNKILPTVCRQLIAYGVLEYYKGV